MRWYALCLLGPAALWVLVVVAVAAMRQIGVLADGAAAPQPFAAALGLSAVPMFGVLVLTDGLGEEVGWRGFALPRMLAGLPWVAASAALGVGWACWHLPLLWIEGTMLEGASPVVLLLELPALSILFTRVFLATGGSALLAVLLHAAMNLSTLSAAATSARDGQVAVVILLLEWLLVAGLALFAPTGASAEDGRPACSG